MQTLWINQCPHIIAVLHELVEFDGWQVLFFCVQFQNFKANCEVNPNQREVPSSRHLAAFTRASVDGQNPAKKFIWCISSHIPSGGRCISFFYSATGDSTMSGLAEVAHNCSPLGPWQVPWFFDLWCLSIEMLQKVCTLMMYGVPLQCGAVGCFSSLSSWVPWPMRVMKSSILAGMVRSTQDFSCWWMNSCTSWADQSTVSHGIWTILWLLAGCSCPSTVALYTGSVPTSPVQDLQL